MNAIACGGCMDTVRVCAGSWPGQKFLATPGTRTCISIAPGFTVECSTSWAVPAPLYSDKYVFMDTVRVCTGSWSWEKFLATPTTQICISIAPGFSVERSTSWAVSAPLYIDMYVFLSIRGCVPTVTWGSITLVCWSETNLCLCDCTGCMTWGSITMVCWSGTNLCLCDCTGWGQPYVQAAFLASDATATGRHTGCCRIAGTDNTQQPHDCWNWQHTITWLLELTTYNHHMTVGTDNTQSHDC